MFFSFIMGSINNLFVGGDAGDIMETKLENVDVWLIKLDGARSSKSLPKILYEKIKDYIKEMILYDHKKLIDGYEFLHQMTPKLRYELCMELFGNFITKEFPHIFTFEHEKKALNTGHEFISFFSSQLYCRVFIANQTIIKKGETFPELYLIF